MKRHLIFIFIIVILVIAVLYVNSLRNQETSFQVPNPFTNQEPLFYSNGIEKNYDTPIPFPETSPIPDEPDFSLYASFKVETPLDSQQNYFIRLKHIDNPQYNRDFYLRKGEKLETAVLHGDYYVYFASGVEWYGEEYLFGANTQLTRTENPISFFYNYDENTSIGRIIHLQSVYNGNLQTTPVTISEFQ